ncbi:hypothetical protein HAHI6034_05725 [Hathewaya histolytica]|uniref:Uncharacterized protein n=1 Tax=Hathewaya histolytica TaxID=1498 RepID=A0A4V6KDB3_HATHI|nr:hypothetical protein [Hathewaya histolytica]VTQ89777.1 Uncharacterised protein [Hathewaya histolytica]
MSKIIPKGKLVEDYRNGNCIKCPECGQDLKHTGERKNTSFIYCDRCKFEIIIN